MVEEQKKLQGQCLHLRCTAFRRFALLRFADLLLCDALGALLRFTLMQCASLCCNALH
jgi:hypothetical protein